MVQVLLLLQGVGVILLGALLRPGLGLGLAVGGLLVLGVAGWRAGRRGVVGVLALVLA